MQSKMTRFSAVVAAAVASLVASAQHPARPRPAPVAPENLPTFERAEHWHNGPIQFPSATINAPEGAQPLRLPHLPDGHVLIDGCILMREEDWMDRSYNPGSAWPSGIVPFTFASDVSTTNRQRALEAMAALNESVADINFIYRTNEANYIQFINSPESYNYSTAVGMRGGQQQVAITSNSWSSQGIIEHELIHALGWYHEQSRPDRDSFVTINWGNIQSDFQSQFFLQANSVTNGSIYDYGSVMHYSACSFSACGSCNSSNPSCRTMTTAVASQQDEIGQRDGYSAGDQLDLILVYGAGTNYYCDSLASHNGDGTLDDPWKNMSTAVSNADGNMIWLRGNRSYPLGSGIILTPMLLGAHGGTATITQ